MQLGAVFPTTEIGTDPGAIRDFAQAIDAMGYSDLLTFDHVLGADASARVSWDGPYQHTDMFHEPFALFGYLAACTSTVVLCTCVLVLGQRQTALVAKQAAAVDVLSQGRLRLGIGIGWNSVEYQALGMDFRNRGRRCEEQIKLLRALWTRQVVTFKGNWHTVNNAGINPLPTQRPIPIWVGGFSEAALQRAARLADGLYPMVQPNESGVAVLERFRRTAIECGRDPANLGIQGGAALGRRRGPDDIVAIAQQWKSVGATHFSLNTMNSGLTTVDAHIDVFRRFKDAMP